VDITDDNILDHLAAHLVRTVEPNAVQELLQALASHSTPWASQLGVVLAAPPVADQRLLEAFVGWDPTQRLVTMAAAFGYISAAVGSAPESLRAASAVATLLSFSDEYGPAMAAVFAATCPHLLGRLPPGLQRIARFCDSTDELDECYTRCAERLLVKPELFLPKTKLGLFTIHDYMHPAEESAFAQVRAAKGLDIALAWVSKHVSDKVAYLNRVQGSIPLTEELFPAECSVVRECRERLGISQEVSLFCKVGPPNAEADGVEIFTLTFTTGALQILRERSELEFLVGHELGHIVSQHVLYMRLANYINTVIEAVSDVTLGFGGVVGRGVKWAALDWQRKCELTADRVGLLCCQDIRAALSTLLKISGLPFSAYGRLDPIEFLAKMPDRGTLLEDSLSVRAMDAYANLDNDHPPLITRARELYRWYESGEYDRVLAELKHRRSSARSYLVARDNQQLGPLSYQELVVHRARGVIQATDVVWRAGWPAWVRADRCIATGPASREVS